MIFTTLDVRRSQLIFNYDFKTERKFEFLIYLGGCHIFGQRGNFPDRRCHMLPFLGNRTLL